MARLQPPRRATSEEKSGENRAGGFEGWTPYPRSKYVKAVDKGLRGEMYGQATNKGLKQEWRVAGDEWGRRGAWAERSEEERGAREVRWIAARRLRAGWSVELTA